MPQALQAEVAALGAKPRTADLRKIIHKLCRHQPLAAQQLADILGRTKNYLINKHLGEMVAVGLLELTYARQPNHPHQTYRAASTQENQP